jgi:hypothetical protein
MSDDGGPAFPAADMMEAQRDAARAEVARLRGLGERLLAELDYCARKIDACAYLNDGTLLAFRAALAEPTP